MPKIDDQKSTSANFTIKKSVKSCNSSSPIKNSIFSWTVLSKKFNHSGDTIKSQFGEGVTSPPVLLGLMTCNGINEVV